MDQIIIQADCLEWLRDQEDCSISTIVTDAPYGYSTVSKTGKRSKGGFMGKTWDYDVPSVEVWREALRVLKPGGTLLCFGGPRTSHRMAVNIEDAGFRICDTLMWLNGQGFPKAQDVGKLIDKKAGAKRKVVRRQTLTGSAALTCKEKKGTYASNTASTGRKVTIDITAPKTKAAKKWNGWKTHALKPSYEPIILAMKGNEGSYANNALKHGVAGLHIDACRVPGKAWTRSTKYRQDNRGGKFHACAGDQRIAIPPQAMPTDGRYPSNVIHDGSQMVLEGFPNVKAGKAIRHRSGGKNCHSETKKPPMDDMGYGDDGSAARFYNELGEGRYPSNIIHDGSDEVLAGFPETKSGSLRPGHKQGGGTGNSILKPEGIIRGTYGGDKGSAARFYNELSDGRYPSNIMHDGSDEVVAGFPETKSGGSNSTKLSHSDRDSPIFRGTRPRAQRPRKPSEGSASRFYPELNYSEGDLRFKYQSKASKKDRGEGNTHPTVKPQALMRWLVRLVCPPGGTVVDLYMGSGTTGVACQLEGFGFIGIDKEAKSFDIAARRMKVVTVLECESGFPEKQIGIT